MGVSASNHFRRAHDHHRIRTLDNPHHIEHGILNGSAFQTFLGDNVGNHLGIRRGVEDRALGLQLIPQLGCVGQCAVTRQGHRALVMIDQQRLGVGAALHIRRRIAAMAKGHVAFLDLLQHIAGEDLRHQTVLAVLLHHTIRVDAHTAAILAAVLQRVERMVGVRHHALAILAVNTKYTTLVLRLVKLLVGVFSLHPKLVFDHFLTFFFQMDHPVCANAHRSHFGLTQSPVPHPWRSRHRAAPCALH